MLIIPLDKLQNPDEQYGSDYILFIHQTFSTPSTLLHRNKNLVSPSPV